MSVSYKPLASNEWKDGLQWYEEVEAWRQRYEQEFMVPAFSNKLTADATTELLLFDVPGGLKDAGRRVVAALMDQRLRAAMM